MPALPVSDSAVYVGDARLQLARALQVAPARLQLLGPTLLEDSLPLAVLLVDVQVWILPDLAENRLAKLAGVEKFDDLQEIVVAWPSSDLQLSSKSLKTLPERFGLVCRVFFFFVFEPAKKFENFCKMSALKQLVILQCNLPDLPPSFVELPSLEELTIAGSRLASLPQEIGQMVTLRFLHLTDNSLKNLPEGLGMLGRLRKLEADRNQLLQLPGSLLDCPDLAVLSLSKNMLKNFPTPARPSNLQVLHLEGNRMSNLQLASMPFLQEVCIDANPLRPSLPNSCGELGSLRQLEATGCLLETLPASIMAATCPQEWKKE
ncbi:SHOC2 [Symbiodinium necroappetens]|uniref:SHOC2 protein n=1 Tax=Symbiodinium necroappetens TaxID=1628268 RepID=A0A812KCQ2_9DINO|nr:SHOC2 [Symbiodinium necroappetens]